MKEHDVVLYGSDPSALTQCVVPFIASALQDHGAAIVVASTEHERAFRSALAALAIDPQDETMRDRLIFLNANDTLRGLFAGGRIERQRFRRLIGNVVRKLSERYTVHAYGEMVGILRSIGNAQAAADLERLWQELLGEVPFRLVCGYAIDVLGAEFHPADMELILTSHTRLISALPDFATSLELGIESALGSKRASAIRGMIAATHREGWATLGPVESTLLWLRERLPDEADDIIDRARSRFSA
jgi:hypothetical protein